MTIDHVRRKAWDDALLVLLVQAPGLSGEELLARIVDEATDSLARLRERGYVVTSDEDE